MTTEVTKTENYGERFTSKIIAEFQSTGGELQAGQREKRLAQHLFVAIDSALKKGESDRVSKGNQNKPPLTWANVNMQHLAMQSVNIVELGLDALIKNHVHIKPYLNGKTKKYDLDVAPGYAGKDLYFKTKSLHPIKDITYKLVHAKDELTVFWKDKDNPVEAYKMKTGNVFDRGEVVGGFGYIEYENPELNKIVVVTMADFDKSQKRAGTDRVYKSDPLEMKYKTIVNRTCDSRHITLDPEKITTAFHNAEGEAQDLIEMDDMDDGNIIDIIPEPAPKKLPTPDPPKKKSEVKPDIKIEVPF